jgi:acetate kinase
LKKKNFSGNSAMSSQILVLNAGSSSIKFAVFNTGQPLKRSVLGMVSGIGSAAAFSARNDCGPLPGALPQGSLNHEHPWPGCSPGWKTAAT